MSPPRVVDLPDHLHDEACALWEAAGLTRPWNDARSDLLRALRGPDSTVLAHLADDGSLVGTAMVGHDGHRGWVYYLAVDAGHQGRGVGRALMAAAEAWVLARDIPKLQLLVRSENDAALGFYGRLGYERGDVLLLGRRLDGPELRG